MLNATLVAKELLSEGLALFYVKPDEGVPEFEAGQYVALGLYGKAPRPAYFPAEIDVPPEDELIRRTYSIGSPPEKRDSFEIYVAVLPQGKFTARLEALEVGGRLFVGKKPVGAFTLKEVPTTKNLIFFSTGTGIAPYISMLKSSKIWEHPRKITLIHGVRYAADFAYRDFLEDLSRQRPDFNYIGVVSRERDTWSGQTGYVQDLLTQKIIVPDLNKDHVMLCGNPGMVQTVEAMLSAIGFQQHTKKAPGNLHLEKYW